MVDFKAMQDKWQKRWEEKEAFKTIKDKNKRKFYCLEMFPYPSASFLHMGHLRNYSIGDSIARYKRMKGFNVLYPMGFDSFGLPAENAAKKAKIHPREYTEDAITQIVYYMKRLGLSYDWSRMIATHRPEYYKWNQFFFLKFFEKGLVYRKKAAVNYCEKCITTLANEEVEGGKCWRCKTDVVQKQLDQWFFKTTAYAEELLKDIEKLEWSDRIKAMQRNWIGRSEGVMINFTVEGSDFPIFTTRPDTIFGVTFMVIASNHPKLHDYIRGTPYEKAVREFIDESKKAESLNDTEFLEKSGIFIGKYAVNPLNGEKIPIYAGNFVVADYATGMIMAVPAHDQRDFEFAKKYNIPIRIVIQNNTKKNALILHGTEGNSKKNWYPWLKKELEKHGYNVIVPDMPDSDFPEIEKWLKCLSEYKDIIDENSIIIGHSLGSPTAIQFLQRFNKKIDKLFLIGPTHKDIDWKKYLEKNPYENTKNIKTVSELHTDWNSIKGKANLIRVHVSEDDPYIPIEVKDHYVRDLNASVKIHKNKGHFNQSAGVKEFPELLAEILEIDSAYVDEGILINSKEFNGLKNEQAIEKISEFIKVKNLGSRTVQYKLRDWLISRQRYWGTPIPMMYCKRCGIIPVPIDELPLLLPEDVNFSGTGNPILTSQLFMDAVCPKCGESANRESDTMGGFMDSSWYFLRYCSPHLTDNAFDDSVNYWMPVDQYVGGIEHAVGHLIYSRFFTKVLRDMGMLKFDEPFLNLFNQGVVYKDGKRMSKSQGNTVTQEEVEQKYGIDTARLYMLFLASPEKDLEWSDQGIEGAYKFLTRMHRLAEEFSLSGITTVSTHKDKFILNKKNSIIVRVTEDIEKFRMNNAIISLMEFVNYIFDNKGLVGKNVLKECLEAAALLLNPFAPHLSEECWSLLGHSDFSSLAPWPAAGHIDEELEYLEDNYTGTVKDIGNVLQLVKIKPSEIMLIVAEPWKYEFLSMMKHIVEVDMLKNPGDVIKALMSTELKKHGSDITKIVPKMMMKLPSKVIPREEEVEFLKQSIPKLEKDFACEVRIVLAEESSEQKAKQAMPGKPAIVVR